MAQKTKGLDTGAISKLKVEQQRQKLKAAEAALVEAQSNELRAKLARESEIGGVVELCYSLKLVYTDQIGCRTERRYQ